MNGLEEIYTLLATKDASLRGFNVVNDLTCILRLFEEKHGIAFVRRSTVGAQFCGRFRLLGIRKY